MDSGLAGEKARGRRLRQLKVEAATETETLTETETFANLLIGSTLADSDRESNETGTEDAYILERDSDSRQSTAKGNQRSKAKLFLQPTR